MVGFDEALAQSPVFELEIKAASFASVAMYAFCSCRKFFIALHTFMLAKIL